MTRGERRLHAPEGPPGPDVRGRGVAVYLDVPDGSGFPDAAGLLELAGALHELAQELVPGAATRTEVTLGAAATCP